MQLTTKQLTDKIVEALQDKRGHNITTIDLSELKSSTAQSYVIATGNTPTQVSALADSVRDKVLEDLKIKPINYDGYRNSIWIVIDFGDVMVHIFVPDARAFYDIEQLWNDGVINYIPDID